jgi:hypothetical protein
VRMVPSQRQAVFRYNRDLGKYNRMSVESSLLAPSLPRVSPGVASGFLRACSAFASGLVSGKWVEPVGDWDPAKDAKRTGQVGS